MIIVNKQKAAEDIIETHAEARLRQSSYPSIRKISCSCDDGTLVLQGRLPTYYQKQLAQAMVSDILGVGQIVNQIEVLIPQRRD